MLARLRDFVVSSLAAFSETRTPLTSTDPVGHASRGAIHVTASTEDRTVAEYRELYLMLCPILGTVTSAVKARAPTVNRSGSRRRRTPTMSRRAASTAAIAYRIPNE